MHFVKHTFIPLDWSCDTPSKPKSASSTCKSPTIICPICKRQGSMFAEPLVPVTPARRERRKRISISPRKRTSKLRASDPYPAPSPIEASLSPDETVVDSDLPLDFSFWNEEKSCFKPITSVERVILLQELRMRYPQVDAITISIPFLIIECRDSVPYEAEQVFLAAGLVCVFIVLGGRLTFGAEYIGHYGEAEPPSDIPEDILRDSRLFNIPKITTFEYFHKLIPSCTHVSSYPTQLVVELEKLSPEEFQNS